MEGSNVNLKRITLDDTVEETVNKINENSTDIEENVSRIEADFISYKDNITLKTSKIEKELNDYKATMQQININQEPKQKTSGYGVISLPPNAAEGQVSGVKIQGLTATNIIKNGNFANGTNGWQGTNATLYADNNKLIVTGDGTATDPRTHQPLNLKSNNKYFISVKVRVTNNECTNIGVYFGGGGDVNLPGLSNPVENQVYIVSGVLQVGISVPAALFIRHRYADKETANGKVMEVRDVMVIDLDAHGLGDKTVDELDKMFANWFDGTKSTISAMRLKSVSADETETSTAYVVAKDEEGKIAELRSLPNGTKDEVRASEGKMIKRVSENLTFDGDENWTRNNDLTQPNTYFYYLPISGVNNYASGLSNLFTVYDQSLAGVDYEGIYFFDGIIRIRINKSRLTTQDVAGFKAWLQGNPVTLTYQLAEPIEIPIQVSGTLTSYPNGTIYIERILPDAGVYTDKISVSHQDAPIKRLDRLSKVDFYTGVETELDVSEAVIAEDKLSFTHPELNAGDIVFFEYEYDVESTEGEAEIEYYDSRYVIKDSVTDKFYKWHIIVADGVPSIELMEV